MKRSGLRHPKTKALARLLDATIHESIGIVEMLADFTGEFAPAGNVGKFENPEIVEGMDMPTEDADVIIAALVKAGFLDHHPVHRLVVHDWHDHAQEWVKKKLKRVGEDFVTRPDSGGTAAARPATDGGPCPDVVRTLSGQRPDSVQTASSQRPDGVQTTSRLPPSREEKSPSSSSPRPDDVRTPAEPAAAAAVAAVEPEPESAEGERVKANVAALRRAGVDEPKRSALAALPNLTPDRIDRTAAELRKGGKREGAIVRRLESLADEPTSDPSEARRARQEAAAAAYDEAKARYDVLHGQGAIDAALETLEPAKRQDATWKATRTAYPSRDGPRTVATGADDWRVRLALYDGIEQREVVTA